MSTLADIRKAAESPVHTVIDDDAPAGHFLATARILGITTTYLCAGELDDEAAPIVGRIEWAPSGSAGWPTAARGAGLKGGTVLLSQWEYSADAFAAMVQR